MNTLNKLKSDKSLSRWLIHNFNRRFNSHLNSVDDVVGSLRSMNASNDNILRLAKAYNTPTGVVW